MKRIGNSFYTLGKVKEIRTILLSVFRGLNANLLYEKDKITVNHLIKRMLHFFVWISIIGFIPYCSSGISLSITNETDYYIKEIKIFYTGGRISLDELKPRSSQEYFVNPASESHIEIEFKDSIDIKYNSTVGIYFERNYSGTLAIKILSLEMIEWEENINSSRIFSACDNRKPIRGSSEITKSEKSEIPVI